MSPAAYWWLALRGLRCDSGYISDQCLQIRDGTVPRAAVHEPWSHRGIRPHRSRQPECGSGVPATPYAAWQIRPRRV